MKSLVFKIIVAILAVVTLYFGFQAGREYLSRRALIDAEEHLRPAITEAEDRAKEAEKRAATTEQDLRLADEQLADVTARLRATAGRLRAARENSKTVEEAYEKVRNSDSASDRNLDPVSLEDLCAKLASLGHQCR